MSELNAKVHSGGDAASQMAESLMLAVNGSNATVQLMVDPRDPLYIIIPITCLYGLILLTGVIGNVSTCIVIARNRSMHTATNYYLFSLAVSDLLLLVSGLPPEMCRLWWPHVYVFGNVFCMVQSYSAETSANATVLTITAFTVERYIAICHPFLTHTMSKLSRAIKFVVAIWIVALCLAIPQAIQYGMYSAVNEQGDQISRCSITTLLIEHAFELSTLVFFVGPMTIITVLYVLIAVKLRGSTILIATGSIDEQYGNQRRRSSASQNRVIKMLVAVVVAFFVCWAPFHAQRLLAVYFNNAFDSNNPPGPVLSEMYHVLDYISGVLYFVSTTVNPLLYNIMSNKFRDAFRLTLAQLCERNHRKNSTQRQSYSTLSRHHTSIRQHHCLNQEGQMGQNHQNTTSIPLQNSCNSFRRLAINKGKPRKFRGGPNQTTMLGRSNGDVAVGVVHIPPDAAKFINNKNSAVNLELLANRLRTFKIFRVGVGVSVAVDQNAHPKCVMRHTSVDSANTISDSSLQDLDEIEYSSSDLVKYMEEVNKDLNCP